MDKIALVTGGSKGIGASIARILSQDGYVIILHYFRNGKKANNIKKEIEMKGRKIYLVKGNLSKEEEIKKMFISISSITTKLDLLVNNAGVYFSHTIEDYPLKDVHYTFGVNFFAVFMVTQLALPYLKKSNIPNIVNISSRLGKEKVVENSSAYASSKAAVIQFTRCCALEFRKYKIRVNAVCPGFANTDINKSVVKNKKFLEKIAKNIPSGRIAEPQDIANVVSFLASNKGSYINGESIGVNGGSILL